jgi:hypothetical protein
MTQTPPNLLELAKQGNANAIAALMNRQLQPKGMTAKAALKDGCLQIMLESAQVPNQQALVAFIRKGITSLEVASIQRMKVYGRHIGEEFPAWSQEFELGRQSNPFSEFSTSPNQENQQTSSSIVTNPPSSSTSKSANKNLCYEIEGVNGQIRLTKNRIIISRKGSRAFWTQGLKGEKEIPLKYITAVQFKAVGNFTNGYLQFSIQGSLESKGGILDATTDENTVMFSELQQPDFEEIKRYIDTVIDGEPLEFDKLQFSASEFLARKEAISHKIAQSKQAEHELSIKILWWVLLSLPFLLYGIYFLDRSQVKLGYLFLILPITFPMIYLSLRNRITFKLPNLASILSWYFGTFTMLQGIGLIIQFNIIAGLASISIASVLVPPACQFIEKRFKCKLSTPTKVIVIVIAVIILSLATGQT